jgi:PAS domain S-box-containing protein
MAEFPQAFDASEKPLVEERVNILLVDDHPANLLALRAVLEDLNQNLVDVRSGEEALQRLPDADFAVILLDVQMQGLDGFETARLIRSREESRHTPIIFLTAYEDNRLPVEEAYKLGAVDYLLKPLVPVILRAKVAGFVELYQKTEQVKRQAERLRQLERREFEQRLAEENSRLRESEQYHRAIGELAYDFAYSGRLDAEGTLVLDSVTDGFLKVTGYTLDELNAQGGYATAIFPADLPLIAQAIGRLMGGQDAEDETRFITKAGTVRWMYFLAHPLWDESHRRVTRVYGAVHDITERRQSEEHVRFQAHLLDSVGQAVVVTDLDGKIIYWNRFAETLYGWSKDEALGRDVREVVVAPEAADQGDEIMVRLRAGQSWSGEFLVQRRDGTTFPAFVTDTPVLDSQGEWQAIIGISADITEQKRVEQALRFLADASAALGALVDYESTLQTVAGLAVPQFADWCTVDMAEPDGALTRLAVVHKDPTKVKLAQEFHQRYPPHPHSPHGLPKVLRTGEPDMMTEVPDELLLQRARNEEHLRLLREIGLKSFMCVPLKGRGKILGVVSFAISESGRRYTEADLTFAQELARRAAIAIENAQLYAELREADRLKDEFLAMLAHELRNPLAPIRNALHVMKQPNADGALIGQVREMAERQVQHMARLLDDLLDVSRISRGRIELRKEVLDVSGVVERSVEAVRPLFEERNHQLHVSLPDEPIRVEADATRLEQVLTNLLNNAAKYTDPNGQIWLTAARVGAEAVLGVRDTGIGVAHDMLPRIFDLFVQAERRLDRSQGGVGIGLSLVKKLMELHGGKVEARSDGPGRGSEFIVRLPAVGAEASAGRRAPASVDGAVPVVGPGGRVLVVDDNVDAADSLALLLKLGGQDVRVAYDGPTALLVAQAFLPKVVFLDIGMPGMDGYEVARHLRQLTELREILLVALTGWGQEADQQRSLEAGFDRHLVKPIEPSALQELVSLPKTESAG